MVRNCHENGSPDGQVLGDMVDNQNRKIGTCWSKKWKPQNCPVTPFDGLTYDFDGLVLCASTECTLDFCGGANEAENDKLCLGCT